MESADQDKGTVFQYGRQKCQYYCHFTSPIRRYPDLQIHRIIKEQLRGRLKEERIEHYREILPEVAKHSSEMERRADEAERETDKLKKVEYMEQHIGEEYEGVISGVTNWGLYVELPNTVEGLVHISTIPGDYYHYNEAACEMVGKPPDVASNWECRYGSKWKTATVLCAPSISGWWINELLVH